MQEHGHELARPHVVDEIRRTGARHAVFYDLNLIANRAYAAELFEALEPLRIQWFGLASTLVDEDLADKVRKMDDVVDSFHRNIYDIVESNIREDITRLALALDRNAEMIAAAQRGFQQAGLHG